MKEKEINFFKKIYYRIEYIGFRILEIFLENLPIRVAYKISYVCGLLAFTFFKKKRIQIYKNLDIVYKDKIPFNKRDFAKKVFIHFCNMIIEIFLSNRLLHKHTWKKYLLNSKHEIENIMKKSIHKYDVTLFCTGHIGNFILFGHLMYYIGFPLVTVIRKHKNPLIMDRFIKILERSGHRIVIREKAYEYFKKLIETKTGYPTLVIDQHSGRKGVYVDFLGKKAYTSPGTAALMRRYNIPTFMGILGSEGNFRFKIYWTKVEVDEITSNKEEDIKRITAKLNEELGKLIMKKPEQWFWMHRRWREYKNKTD